MKLLFVTNHYLPGYKAGGPIKSVFSLCESMKSDFDITVMTSNHDFGEIKPYEDVESDKVISSDKYNIIYLSKINIGSIKKYINEINPEVVYLNSFFSKLTLIILLLKKLKLIKSKIILAPRGEISDGALSLKAKKKKTFLKLAQIINLYTKDILFHATDRIEKDDIQSLFPNKIIEIPNLTTSNIENFDSSKKESGKLKIVFLSRISQKKNLIYALEILKEIDKENVLFDIYGTKEDKGYWNRCEDIINTFKHITVNYKGSLKPVEIPKILSQYHLFFLPTKNENFGHVIVEAMQSGLIPLISDQTPWNDLEEQHVGYSIELKNKDGFIDAINQILNYNDEEFIEQSKHVKNYIDKKLDNNVSVSKYISMFQDRLK